MNLLTAISTAQGRLTVVNPRHIVTVTAVTVRGLSERESEDFTDIRLVNGDTIRARESLHSMITAWESALQ